MIVNIISYNQILFLLLTIYFLSFLVAEDRNLELREINPNEITA